MSAQSWNERIELHADLLDIIATDVVRMHGTAQDDAFELLHEWPEEPTAADEAALSALGDREGALQRALNSLGDAIEALNAGSVEDV